MTTTIGFITDEAGFERAFGLMSLLRPHLSHEDFLAAVPRLMESTGYRLVGLEYSGRLVALAGVRMAEWLHRGRYLEVEELVTDPGARSRGHGRALLAWIRDYGRDQGCQQLRLVSGVQRSDAHRFYEREGMVWEAKYFSMDLGAA